MARFSMRQLVDAPPAAVWRVLADIAGHAEWMADAESIEFTSEQRRGVGTTFDCATRIGPLRTRDRMEVTRWQEGEELGVRHVGLVTGEGVFTLRPLGPQGSRTELDWVEQLRFPWYLGGPLTGLLARPVLRGIWRGNLRRLASRVTDPRG